jgi:hypothetical protein
MKSKKNFRKLVLLQGAAILGLGAQAAFAGLNVNINLGEPPRQVIVAPPPPVYVAPPPVYAPPYPPPAYAPPEEAIQLGEDIQFVYPDALGFYVAVGVPYDLFYLQNSYYLYRDGRWLRAPSSRGPWIAQRYRELPPGLRRYGVERIREYRTREFAVYNRDREHYRGRHFRSEKELRKERRREVKEERREEKHRDKEERREHREGRD